MRNELETNTTAPAEDRLAAQALAELKKDRSRPKQKLLISPK